MNDVALAKSNLAGHSIVLCKEGKLLTSDRRGVSPMIDFLQDGIDLSGYSVADKIVGKAAAMLFVKAGIKEVYAEILSVSGKNFLEEHGINVGYETIAEKIINRTGDDICPMEKTVADITDPEEGYEAIRNKLKEMRK